MSQGTWIRTRLRGTCADLQSTIIHTWDMQGITNANHNFFVFRTYIGFDIIKRIMRDFFGYNVRVSTFKCGRASTSSFSRVSNLRSQFVVVHEHY